MKERQFQTIYWRSTAGKPVVCRGVSLGRIGEKERENGMSQKKFVKYLAWIPSILFMIAIFYFSAQPAEESSELSGSVIYQLLSLTEKIPGISFTASQRIAWCEMLQTPVRKAAHMSEYAVLALLFYLPLALWMKEKSAAKQRFFSVALAMAYAATDEFHQLFVPGRAGMVTDVLIDGTGAVLGIVVFSLLRLLFQRIKKAHRAHSS